jgi:3-phenylpropionate/cinnamic acid dioxygenase small subunit
MHAEDHAEIANLLARYCLLLDHDDVDGWVSLFVTEGTYGVYGRSFNGHDGLREMMAGAPGGLHLGGPPVVELVGADRARTRQNLMFVDRATNEIRSAVYDDELVRTDAGWRFLSRRCQFIGPDGLGDRPPRVDTSLRDQLTILRTLAAYCQLCDDGDFSALIEQFTADGVITFGDEIATGREELRAWFDRRQPPHQRGKHLTFNPIIELEGRRARVVSDFVFLRIVGVVPTPTITGRYRDEFRRDGDDWHIQRRDIEPLRAPSS